MTRIAHAAESEADMNWTIALLLMALVVLIIITMVIPNLPSKEKPISPKCQWDQTRSFLKMKISFCDHPFLKHLQRHHNKVENGLTKDRYLCKGCPMYAPEETP